MVQSSRLELISVEQLDALKTVPNKQRARIVLRRCRNRQGILDFSCFATQMCPEPAQALGTCVKQTQANPFHDGEPMCPEESAQFSRCIKDEYRLFLMGASPVGRDTDIFRDRPLQLGE
mmetsp:Transcript_16148/g.23937  ORF Transcript_16148/g.23937 Transcript_16148/m.23937 type:complete len:119 (-) Transcript_16148:85-441(-)